MKLKFLLILISLISTVCFSQTENKELLLKAYNRLDSINIKSIKTGYLLNKGFFLGQYMAKMKSLKPDLPNENIIFMTPFEWKSIFLGIQKSGVGIKEKSVNPEDILDSIEFSSSRIPIGIIAMTGEWLDEYEIEENINASKKGYEPKKIYEKIPIIAAAPLQQEIFSNEVIFEFPESIFQIDEKDSTVLSIDFSDGNGFIEINKNEKIGVKYGSPGEKSITFNLKNSISEYTIYSKILVTIFDSTEPDFIFDLNPSEINSPSGRTQSLTGGQALLYNGCDRIFDKPVIIVEGFDPTNEYGISANRQKYIDNAIESKFKSNGYDLVYLNFSDGGATIQSNSNVLKQLLIDIKQKKSGNFPITVIGESMGGLVARYTLTSMESVNQNHGVGKYISFDSPHLGANVPVGFQKLLEDVDDIDIRQLFNIAQNEIDKGKAYLNSSAAKQMLLRYKGASPHADFTALQNEFNQLGFPSQNNIENINIINASSIGTTQAPTGSFNPGDLLFNGTSIHGFANVVIKNRTNNLNSSTKVSSIWITVGAVPTTIKDRTYNFDSFNYDISSGGYMKSAEIDFQPKWWQHAALILFGLGYNVITNYDRDEFSFVPLFSSMASTSNRTSQSHLNQTVSYLVSNNQTPFDATYSSSNNTFHASAAWLYSQWSNLLSNEFGISSTTCNQSPGTMSPPPSPRFNTSSWSMCQNETRDFWITNSSSISNLYTHRWDITGPNGYFQSVFSDNLTLSYLAPGSYTITLIRTYSGGAYSNLSTTYSRVLTVYSSTSTECSGNGGGGGPIQRVHYAENPIQGLNESIPIKNTNQIHKIRFWPNPANNRLNVKFEIKESSDLNIIIYPASSNRSGGEVLTSGFRPEGTFEEEYDISHLQSGLYVLQIQTTSQIIRERLIIN